MTACPWFAFVQSAAKEALLAPPLAAAHTRYFLTLSRLVRRCEKLQAIAEFEGTRRNCARALLAHNARRKRERNAQRRARAERALKSGAGTPAPLDGGAAVADVVDAPADDGAWQPDAVAGGALACVWAWLDVMHAAAPAGLPADTASVACMLAAARSSCAARGVD